MEKVIEYKINTRSSCRSAKKWGIIRMFFISYLLLLFPISSFANEAKSQGGIYLGTTRVVFDSIGQAAVFTANNSSSNDTWLIRSWVSPYVKTAKEVSEDDAIKNFIITPPLYRLDPNSSVQLRINRTGGILPEDRESVYYINVLAIPPKPKDTKGSVIQFALNTQIKLFYRPHRINDEREIVKAYSNINLKSRDGILTLNNPSPYYLTLTNIVLNKTITLSPGDPMIPPFGNISIEAKATHGTLSYQVINDFGGKTDQVSKSF